MQKGLVAMREKFTAGHFGVCPRVLCEEQHVLPVGRRDADEDVEQGRRRKEGVKLFCPRCREVYEPPSAYHRALDGAYWGATFPHLFLMAFPELEPEGQDSTAYEPRVFGFRVATREPWPPDKGKG
jgi:casein kinase II subunit beta